jgi:hypothetical protein
MDDHLYVESLDRNVRFPEERWNHIIEAHPELKPIKKDIKKGIIEPDNIYYSSNSNYHIFISYIPEFITKYIIIYVKLLEDDAFIISAHSISEKRLNRKLKKWKQLTLPSE